MESFFDSDWSGHQSHRRSTSCGVHILNGGFFLQRPHSKGCQFQQLRERTSGNDFKSCDGIYLRRRIEFLAFLVDSNINHHLLVGSSSESQIAMKLGPGKLKHVAGKFLWIQHFVMNGETSLVQPLPTVSGELSLRSRPRSIMPTGPE